MSSYNAMNQRGSELEITRFPPISSAVWLKSFGQLLLNSESFGRPGVPNDRSYFFTLACLFESREWDNFKTDATIAIPF